MKRGIEHVEDNDTVSRKGRVTKAAVAVLLKVTTKVAGRKGTVTFPLVQEF